MINYLKLARAGNISFTEAYTKAHNALVELAKTPNPTNEEINAFDALEKQLKFLKTDIANEYIKKEGYTFNEQTQMWNRHNCNR